MGPFEKALRQFHALDWRRCVRELDLALAADATRPSGLEMSPPSIITGDPFALQPGNCVLVMGINPKWPDEGMQRIDCIPAQLAWEAGFEAYRTHRQPYFAEAPGRPGRTNNADPRYGRGHFSRLGNTLARALGVGDEKWNAGSNARRFFREHAAILDLIPYWSRNTGNLNLAPALEHHCVQLWRGVILAFIQNTGPKLIVVNNCGERDFINAMLRCELKPADATGFFIGRTNAGTPVLAHKFLNNWRGVTTESYINRFQEAARQLGITTPILNQ